MNSSLPLPPALATALTQHGALPSATPSLPNNSPKRTNITALTIHPTLPRIAYLTEETVSLPPSPPQSQLPSIKKKSDVRSYSSAIKTQRIVIQQFDRRKSVILKDEYLATLPMEQLALALNKFRAGKLIKNKSTTPLTLASLGPLHCMEFLDSASLFWSRRGRGSVDILDGSIRNADTHIDQEGGLGGDLCLSLQFTNVLTVVRLAQSHNSGSNKFSVLCCLEGQKPLNIESSNSHYLPSSPLIPLTNSIVIYGCSDGAMRFHNLVPSLLYSSRVEAMGSLSMSTSLFSSKGTRGKQGTVKSVRGPNGRNDPIVKIVNVSPFYYGDREESTAAASGGVDQKSISLHSRLLTACSSGVGYLWDVHLKLDRASGSIRDLTVDPPLARIDGLGRLTVSPRNTSPTKATKDEFWSEMTIKGQKENAKAPYFSVMPAIQYDYNRDLLMWTLPSEAPAASVDHRGDFKLEQAQPNTAEAKKEEEDKTFLEKWCGNGDNGGFVKVWNMSAVNALISGSKKKESSSSSPHPPPKFAPAAVFKLHPFSASAASSNSVFGGLQHCPLPPNSLAYTCLTRDGSELMVQAAPLPLINACTDESWLVQSSLSTLAKKSSGVDKAKIFYATFVTQHALPISSIWKSNMSRVRGSSYAASFACPDSFAVASDQGVIVGMLAKGGAWLETESKPLEDTSPLSFDTSFRHIHTIISGGPVSSLNNRPGVLFVENNSVFASRLTTPRTNSDNKDSVVEKISLQDPMMMHVLQGQSKAWQQSWSTRTSIFAEIRDSVSSQPQLIPSPSGRYLCLFWENEMRYEILHARSLLTKEGRKEASSASGMPGALDGRGPGVSPSVDSGTQALSFAWIGDDDRFAILLYVDLNTSKVAVQSSPARGGEVVPLQPMLDTRKKVLQRIISPSNVDSNPEDDNAESGQIRPHVELKKLAEAQIDAVELAAGASVAAATTVNLGRLAIRGGDRAVPTILFGGPALCVGCVSISNRANEPCIDSSAAYFYARKSGAVKEHDERASSYMTLGPEIPYPSLVAWDEEGKLCTMAFGLKVAIYLSQPPNFTLLGAVNISTIPSNSDASLLSLKFIHGVLYCSKPSSVHAIFLGNLNNPDAVCEIDVFTIATTEVPMDGTENADSSHPVPAVTSLMQPFILAYHCGGLLISTSCGLRLLPLSHPILRIGTLLGANLVEKARKWIHATSHFDHDAMAHFLIRRGRPDLAISDLDGLSVEYYIDLCMMFDHVDELGYLIEKDGASLVQQISNWRRGSLNGSYSAILCIGMYFLGNGRMDTAKKWTEFALNSGINEVISDAMKLALYMSAADRVEGQDLLSKVSDVMKFDSSGRIAFLGTV